MCTAVIYKKQKNLWPFIISFNRDESFNRKTLTPDRHWEDSPFIIAGRDQEHGGTWFGINDYGIFSCILNRDINKKNSSKFISRGKLVINLLKEKKISDLKKIILNEIELDQFQGFNLIISDLIDSYWYKHDSQSNQIYEKKIHDGITILTDDDSNNFQNDKIKEYYYYFNNVKAPNPEKNNWEDWSNLMEKKSKYKNGKLNRNICFNFENIYGTVSCSQLAISQNNSILYRYSDKQPFNKNFSQILI